MQARILTYQNSRISYYQFGSGPRTAFCLHGYAQEGGSFGFLEKWAGDQFCFFSLDLPFHGKTEWNEPRVFTVRDLQNVIEKILRSHHSEGRTATPRLTLLGYSLGGRLALHLYQAWPEGVEKLVLLAPDGLKVNFWYWLATQTRLGTRLFAYTMKNPGWFFGLLKAMNRAGLVNSSIFKFVNYYIGDAEVRQLLYQRWTGLRKLKPRLEKIKSLIRQHRTPARLVYGQHDRIILPVVGEKFRKGIEAQCELRIIHSGHQVLHENHVKELLPPLLH